MKKKATKSIEFISPIRKGFKWTHYKAIVSIKKLKEDFLNNFDEKYWIEAKQYFDVYYKVILKTAQKDRRKYFEDFENIIFQFYIFDIKRELMMFSGRKIVDSQTNEIDTSNETKEIFLNSAFYHIINKIFLFVDYLIIAYSNDVESLIELKNNSKLNHLNSVTNNRMDYKHFLSAYFEFWKKLKNNTTTNYTHNRALEDSADKYRFYDTRSMEWINNFETIRRNYENWYRRFKDDPSILNYVDEYQADKNLLAQQVSK